MCGNRKTTVETNSMLDQLNEATGMSTTYEASTFHWKDPWSSEVLLKASKLCTLCLIASTEYWERAIRQIFQQYTAQNLNLKSSQLVKKGSRGSSRLYFVEEGAFVNGESYGGNILSVTEQCLNNVYQFMDKEEAFLMQDGARPLVSSATYELIYEHITNRWTD